MVRLLVVLLTLALTAATARAELEIVRSTHGNLLLSGYAIGRYTYQERSGPPGLSVEPLSTFTLRSASLIFRGDVFKYAGYFIYLDAASSPALVDAYGTLRVIPHTEFRMGQFLVPFSRESYTSTSQLLLIDRSLVATNVAPPLGRDVGAQLEVSFRPEEKPYWGALAVAGVNGSGPNVADDNASKDLALRLQGNPLPWRPLAGLTLEAYLYFGKPFTLLYGTGTGRRYGGAVAFDHDRFSLQGEVLARETTYYSLGAEIANTAGGFYLQGSYKQPLPWEWLQVLEPALRLESFDPDDAAAGDELGSLTGGLNAHFDRGHHCKLMVNYQKLTEEAREFPNDKISAQFQVRF
ncbi:MAG: hypothetical protein JSU81_10030 [Candidatus Coatesbacteria bacterium]|nr:MAG: hypothetical protein JSU81_10030 [Candidatus Coatesbacteria bacterium]